MGVTSSSLPPTLTSSTFTTLFPTLPSSLFDTLSLNGELNKEDLIKHLNTNQINSAFVFIKPQANTLKTQEYVRSTLSKFCIQIKEEGTIPGTVINEKKLIDQHYYSIASKATLQHPSELNVPEDKFMESFKEEWVKVVEEGRCVNALQACERWNVNESTLEKLWRSSEKSHKVVKFGGGFYCGLLECEGEELYVFNAFFMEMRSKFIGDNEVYFFSVEWEKGVLDWEGFRNRLLGPTDPNEAPEGSIRRTILEKWEEFGLKSKPNKADNGVHASASPLEGLSEKCNWLGSSIDSESFGKALLFNGFDEQTIKEYCIDPSVEGAKDDGVGKGSVFDAVEDMDAEDCLRKLCMIKFEEGKEGRFDGF
ncbi:hypothetical protein TrVE_jg9123 [Triparma verrucosa]|uniref:Nucleoside-diphosphate kinase n=1 Tax=Triparma verrucosa TaxID=1606542 RepID=A0A9W7B9F8_9STRA|nr:hypothetical protein TrVE_jg9123 [Triparma verrucosa]